MYFAIAIGIIAFVDFVIWISGKFKGWY